MVTIFFRHVVFLSIEVRYGNYQAGYGRMQLNRKGVSNFRCDNLVVLGILPMLIDVPLLNPKYESLVWMCQLIIVVILWSCSPLHGQCGGQHTTARINDKQVIEHDTSHGLGGKLEEEREVAGNLAKG